MKDGQSHIMEKAALLFSQHGAKVTTMDELALGCGISKRTLYQYFETKEVLVMAIAQNIVSKNEQHIRIGPGISPNAAAEIISLFQYIQNQLEIITPQFVRDIRKYYPDAYSLFVQFKTNKLVPFVKQNIARGLREDIYRSDIDIDTTCWLYTWLLQNAIEETSVPFEKRFRLVWNTNYLFLYGIMNAKGMKLVYTSIKQGGYGK